MNEKEPKNWNEETAKAGHSFISPITGLNDNVDFLGRRLHVQTEHTGFPAAHIVTQVFCSGRVMLSKKTDYASEVCESPDLGKIQQLMKAQHCQIIQELKDKQARKQASR
jgi:hypothetical protein